MVNSHCNRTTASFHKDFMRRSIVEAFARAMIQFFLRLLQVLFLLQSQSLFLSGSPVGCADRKEARRSYQGKRIGKRRQRYPFYSFICRCGSSACRLSGDFHRFCNQNLTGVFNEAHFSISFAVFFSAVVFIASCR